MSDRCAERHAQVLAVIQRPVFQNVNRLRSEYAHRAQSVSPQSAHISRRTNLEQQTV